MLEASEWLMSRTFGSIFFEVTPGDPSIHTFVAAVLLVACGSSSASTPAGSEADGGDGRDGGPAACAPVTPAGYLWRAEAIDAFCGSRGIGCLRFDYSGTGSSGGNFAELRRLKGRYPRLGLLLAVGGWTGPPGG